MVRRFVFFITLFFSFSGLAWWSNELKLQKLTEQSSASGAIQLRQELVEVLDRLVVYEHYYKSIHGSFTKILSRLGLTISPEIRSRYEIRITDVIGDSFLITAFSEKEPQKPSRRIEIASVNESFEFQSNFELPEPRVDYLKAQAKKHLRKMVELKKTVRESGIYTGYFKYEFKKDTDQNEIAVATGQKFPIWKSQLVYLKNELGINSLSSGSFSFELMGRNKEEVELAMAVFRGESGRSAQSWHELELVAKPQLLELLETPRQIFPMTQYKVEEIDFADRKVSSVLDKGAEVEPDLEIEPLYPESHSGGRLTK